VKSVVERRGGRIRLDVADEKRQTGLSITVHFPLQVKASGGGH
jgi:hypothetical protein